jgi:transcriptional regulator with XRE-family HTH domain
MTVSRWERGERQPSMRMLQRLAKALGVPVTALLE